MKIYFIYRRTKICIKFNLFVEDLIPKLADVLLVKTMFILFIEDIGNELAATSFINLIFISFIDDLVTELAAALFFSLMFVLFDRFIVYIIWVFVIIKLL